ncbi:MAG TPA: M13 family metallopeptidase [Steroidobacteraceae bacterium]|nr:M13 family metallopeptidase [Steroidobacteraceae bacterium]
MMPRAFRTWRIALIAAACGVTIAAGGAAPSMAGGAATANGGAATAVLAGMDRSVAPGDDFFMYANGAWLSATRIPPDQSSWSTFAMLRERTIERTSELIRTAAARPNPTSEERKIADYYATFMDEAAIEKKGLEPLEPALRAIARIDDRHKLASALGAAMRADVDVLNNTHLQTPNLFGLWVAADLDDPTHYIPILLQGGLEMPDRDYYLDPSQHMAAIRAQYLAHIGRVLTLAHIADARAKATRIFELERRMAQAHWSRADSEQVRKTDNHWTRADFDRRAPGLDWSAFFAAARLEGAARFIVWQPSALIGLAALTKEEPLETWKEYLTFHALEHAAPYLPKAFVAERFAFYGRTLSGTPELSPRWKRAVDQTDDALGDAVGKLYVARYFPPSEKARAEAMVRNLLAAYRVRIERLDWMAPQTKRKAEAKLATLKVSVGYPDTWRDYSALEVVSGDALGNAMRAEQLEYERSLGKLGRPVDRDEWVMTPQTVNAVNLPVLNALNFPAAYLQPPNFDPHRPSVMDYGAAGAVIGHEISHSFDDQGALFDASGKLANWWTKADFAHFEAAGARLVAQYDRYRPFPDLAVNGKQTLSENIADVAGLSAAYDAYRLSLNGQPGSSVGGLTTDQLFFLSFAQSWRTKMREAALRRLIVTDGHAPARYRADTVRNIDTWYAAFGVAPGMKLYLAPADRVRIW